jgi:recombinational DNA repair protein RecT
MMRYVLTCRALCKLNALRSQHSQDQETDPQLSFALKFYLPGIEKTQSNVIHCKHKGMMLNHAVSIINYKLEIKHSTSSNSCSCALYKSSTLFLSSAKPMGFTYMKDRYSSSDYKDKSCWSNGKKN